ncbi:Hypothetical protein SCLAV_0176 [Streptomyces clavuligerus]|uniref:Uncharacterized protein n=1 Tax=Streptomyces clavuligerus TaxID=1901 RepID=E2Q705_STRCL|nr:Hypothetical protein SCLAV_0176 [Streptomyces clavuligerus]
MRRLPRRIPRTGRTADAARRLRRGGPGDSATAATRGPGRRTGPGGPGPRPVRLGSGVRTGPDRAGSGSGSGRGRFPLAGEGVPRWGPAPCRGVSRAAGPGGSAVPGTRARQDRSNTPGRSSASTVPGPGTRPAHPERMPRPRTALPVRRPAVPRGRVPYPAGASCGYGSAGRRSATRASDRGLPPGSARGVLVRRSPCPARVRSPAGPRQPVPPLVPRRALIPRRSLRTTDGTCRRQGAVLPAGGPAGVSPGLLGPGRAVPGHPDGQGADDPAPDPSAVPGAQGP